MNGDSLNVLQKSGLVLVQGEVNVPGFISFKKNHSVKKYLDKAGGLTSFAEEKNIYIFIQMGLQYQFLSLVGPKLKKVQR